MTNVDEIIKQNNKVVFDFHANWCGPCKVMEPELQLAESSGIHVQRIDIEEETELTELFGIQSVPTLVYYKDGEEVKTTHGFCNAERIINVLA
jgi:thioredoxin 1